MKQQTSGQHTLRAWRSLISCAMAALGCIVSAPSASATNAPLPGIPGWTLDQALTGATTLDAYNHLAYPVPEVSGAAADRFRRSASVYTRPGAFPEVAVLVYDHLTRCGLSIAVRAGDAGVPTATWVRPVESRNSMTVPTIAVDGMLALRQFGKGMQMISAPDCPMAVSAAYAGDPTALQGAGVLTRHAQAILNGTRIGSKEAPLSRGGFMWTVQGKIASLGYLGGTELLAAYRDEALTVVVIGDPGGTTRFATQYRNLPDGRWKFEGASALGLGFARIVEKKP